MVLGSTISSIYRKGTCEHSKKKEEGERFVTEKVQRYGHASLTIIQY